MQRYVFSLLAALGMTAAARAHFVFVVPAADGASAKAVFSEDLTPDENVDIAKIAHLKLMLRDAAGIDTPLEVKPGEHALNISLPGAGPRMAHGKIEYGVIARGGNSMLLMYYPKALHGDWTSEKATLGAHAPIELTPVGKPGALRLRLLADGKPMLNAEVNVLVPNADAKKVTTDADGLTPVFAELGQYGAWARRIENKAGEVAGKKYAEVRHYATLVTTAGAAPASTAAVTPAASEFPPLPVAVSSFGAVALDGWIYVQGGHAGQAHQYSKETAQSQFLRVPTKGGDWERLPAGVAAQGMTLVAHKGAVLRLGGMQPRNEKGADADNHSLASVDRYDPTSRIWSSLPAMPSGRSSFDAGMIGDKLYVVGGWTMNGAKSEPTWRDDVWVLDLANPSAGWASRKQPFQRRALTAVVHQEKLVLFGGLTSEGEAVRNVTQYDPAADAWTELPAIPEGPMNGFTPASLAMAGRLYVSPADGKIYRLTSDAKTWETVGTLAKSRIVHRLAPATGGRIVAFGGASRGGPIALTEVITPTPGAAPAAN